MYIACAACIMWPENMVLIHKYVLYRCNEDASSFEDGGGRLSDELVVWSAKLAGVETDVHELYMSVAHHIFRHIVCIMRPLEPR